MDNYHFVPGIILPIIYLVVIVDDVLDLIKLNNQ
jgi:hypothetical protein